MDELQHFKKTVSNPIRHNSLDLTSLLSQILFITCCLTLVEDIERCAFSANQFHSNLTIVGAAASTVASSLPLLLMYEV